MQHNTQKSLITQSIEWSCAT